MMYYSAFVGFFMIGIALGGYQGTVAGRIKRENGLDSDVSKGLNGTQLAGNMTAIKLDDKKANSKNGTHSGATMVGNATAGNVTSEVHATPANRARLVRQITDALHKHKQLRSKFADNRHGVHRFSEHKPEAKKHKRHTWRKSFQPKDDDLVMPYAEIETWEHEAPERHHSLGIVERSFEEVPVGLQEPMMGVDNTLHETSPFNLMSLANLLFGKYNGHSQEHVIRNHHKDPFGIDAEEVSYIVNRPESKLTSFLRNARTAGVLEANPKPFDMMSAPSGNEEEELEIRCPIHHVPGSNDFLGLCSCDIVKNHADLDF